MAGHTPQNAWKALDALQMRYWVQKLVHKKVLCRQTQGPGTPERYTGLRVLAGAASIAQGSKAPEQQAMLLLLPVVLSDSM